MTLEFIDTPAIIIDAFGTAWQGTIKVMEGCRPDGGRCLPEEFRHPGGPLFRLESKDPLTYREVDGSEEVQS